MVKVISFGKGKESAQIVVIGYENRAGVSYRTDTPRLHSRTLHVNLVTAGPDKGRYAGQPLVNHGENGEPILAPQLFNL